MSVERVECDKTVELQTAKLEQAVRLLTHLHEQAQAPEWFGRFGIECTVQGGVIDTIWERLDRSHK